MNLKKWLFTFMFCLLLCNLSFAKSMKWDVVWDADNLPELFQSGTIFDDLVYAPQGESVSRTVNSGIFQTQTSSGANANYTTKDGVFNVSEYATIEWRFQNDSAVGYYTTAILIKQAGVGYVGFKIAWNHGCNPYETNSYVGIYYDASYWSTVRILVYAIEGKLTCADLFYKDANGDWVYGNTSVVTAYTSYTYDTIQIGDIGGNWGGQWNEDYLMFTDDYATLEELNPPDTIPSDINGDTKVDMVDLMTFATEWLIQID